MQLGIERRMVPHIPWGLIASILAVSLLGIWNLASASRPPHNPVWTHQMVNLLVALAAAGAVCPRIHDPACRATHPVKSGP